MAILSDVSCTDEEAAICALPSAPIARTARSRSNIVWRYAGVRPLLDDGASKAQEATRDYVLELNSDARAVAYSAARSRPIAASPRRRWRNWRRCSLACAATGLQVLRCPAAIFPGMALMRLRADMREPISVPAPTATMRRLVRAYGTLSAEVLGDARKLGDLGQCFGADLTRTGGGLAGTPRMGTHRGGCAVAAEQGWLAHDRGYAQHLLLIIKQDAVRRPVHIIVLTGPQGPQEHRQSTAPQQNPKAQQIQDNVHAALPLRRKLFSITARDEPDIAAAASHGVTNPATASGTINRLYPIDNAMFCRMTLRARRAVSITEATGDSFAPWNNTSATVWLISAAVVGDADTVAAASDGPSFSPSPTISTLRPDATSASIAATFCIGVRSACQALIPSALATVATALPRSPDSRCTANPSERSRSTVAAASSRIVSTKPNLTGSVPGRVSHSSGPL